MEGELEEREENPLSSPSGFGMDGAAEPYEHFELLREAQKEYWCCEAYCRVCFLYGMMHLIMSFSYWVTLHCISELGMIWCSIMGAAGMTAGVWVMFRLDVLPEHGGAFPIEISGPFLTSIALGMMYGQNATPLMITIARVVACVIILFHVILCFRMYSVAKPTMGKAHHQAKESGGRLFNHSGSCDTPAWLPSAFQHVMYLISPPKTDKQLEQELADRENNSIRDEALANIDMTPWYYLRILIFVIFLGWVIQLVGHVVECEMGERMIVSNPGAPPWTRTGQWFGWELGPVTSKHYAHVTPQRGHWAWQRGWGPQGQQELWASDVFGFAPEADAWWREDVGVEPLEGIAGVGKNTWAIGRVAYGQNEPKWGPKRPGYHDWIASGGHRRLHGFDEKPIMRPVVPLPVEWPSNFEPDHLACNSQAHSGDMAIALTSSGVGSIVTLDALKFPELAKAAELVFDGLMEIGLTKSVTWGPNNIVVVTDSGRVASCPFEGISARRLTCSPVRAPPLPGVGSVFEHDGHLRAAVASPGSINLLQLTHSGNDSPSWTETHSLQIPVQDIGSIAASHSRLLVTTDSGMAYHWDLVDGVPSSPIPTRDFPAHSGRRNWQSSCILPSGKVMRLSSSWHLPKGGVPSFRSELVV